MSTTRRFFSGTTVERAVLEAAGHFGLEPEELEFTKLDKQGMGSRGKVVIKVDPNSPKKSDTPEPTVDASDIATIDIDAAAADSGDSEDRAAAEAEEPAAEAEESREDAPTEEAEEPEAVPEPEPAPEPELVLAEPLVSRERSEEPETENDPTEESTENAADAAAAEEPAADAAAGLDEMVDLPRSASEARRAWPKASGKVEEAARKWTESLLRVASLDLEVEVYERDGEVEIHLSGADAEVATEDGGEVLRAMQHLLPRLLLGSLGESIQCRVDCNDFRELHEEGLRAQALNAASEALADGGEVTLEPMHPADRRIVHLTLSDNELVRTESLGRGFFKRVLVRVA